MAHPAFPAAVLVANRRIASVLAAAASAVVAILGWHYAHDTAPGHLDGAIDSRVQLKVRGHLRAVRDLVAVADPPGMIVGCFLLAALLFLAGRRRAAALAALGPAAAAGVTELVLKPLIGRRLGDWLSFPSGHTTVAASISMVVVVVMLGPSRPRWPLAARLAASGIALLWGVGVATAMVGAGYHYATDTVGGFCVAIAMVLAVAMGIDLAADRHRRKLVGSRHDPTRGARTSQPV
jgi:membrane-associated phospholipid phosphatase